jgi:hypothetical protein
MNRLNLLKEYVSMKKSVDGVSTVQNSYEKYHDMLCKDLYPRMNELKNYCNIYSENLDDISFVEFFEKIDNSAKPLFDSNKMVYGKIPNELLSNLIDFENYIENFKLRNDGLDTKDLDKTIKKIFLILPNFRKLKDVKNY